MKKEKAVNFLKIPVNRIIALVLMDIMSIIVASFAALYIRFDFSFSAIYEEFLLKFEHILIPVSYTHLDVYKRQLLLCAICWKKSLRDNVVNRFYFFLNLFGFVVYCCGSFVPETSRIGYYMIISQIFLLPRLIGEMENKVLRRLCLAAVVGAFGIYFVFLLKGMYAVDIRLLPYRNWIFN